MKKEVTATEDTLIEILREQRWSRVTLRFTNGELGPIEISETVIIPVVTSTVKVTTT